MASFFDIIRLLTVNPATVRILEINSELTYESTTKENLAHYCITDFTFNPFSSLLVVFWVDGNYLTGSHLRVIRCRFAARENLGIVDEPLPARD